MAGQSYFYPAGSGGSSTNPSVSANGAPIPSSSTLVAGKDGSSNQQPLSVDASGVLNVSVLSIPGSITANQGTAAVVASAWPIKISDGTTVAAVTLANALKVDGSAVTQPVSAASLPLPSGASTSANQVTELASLASIDDKLPGTLGQKASALSLAVVFASDQSALSVSAVQSGTWNINNISGTISLPTGASTSALQTSGNSSLSSIDGKLNSLGQKASANSMPVVLASDQSAIPVSQSGTWNVGLSTGSNTVGKVDQGAGGASAWKVDGSAVTQPVSGTVNAKASTPTAGTVTQAAITVGTSAVRLTVSGSAPSANRSVLVATPDSSSTAKFYIGSSSVANSGANRGVQITANQSFIANSDAGDYYIISDTAAQTVYVMEQA